MRGPLLVTRGPLGAAFAREARAVGLGCVLTDKSIHLALAQHRPAAVIDAAESDAEALAAECARRDVPLVVLSTDQVFDGEGGRPYFEGDAPHPLTGYGEVRARAEARALALHPRSLVVRTGPRFSPWDENDFVGRTLGALCRGAEVRVPCDGIVSPTYVPHLTRAVLELLRREACGIWHLANRGPVTWEHLARESARRAGLNQHGIFVTGAVPGPRYSVLGTEKGVRLPLLDDALTEYFASWRSHDTPRLAA